MKSLSEKMRSGLSGAEVGRGRDRDSRLRSLLLIRYWMLGRDHGRTLGADKGGRDRQAGHRGGPMGMPFVEQVGIAQRDNGQK